jgi:hypothetical protein
MRIFVNYASHVHRAIKSTRFVYFSWYFSVMLWTSPTFLHDMWSSDTVPSQLYRQQQSFKANPSYRTPIDSTHASTRFCRNCFQNSTVHVTSPVRQSPPRSCLVEQVTVALTFLTCTWDVQVSGRCRLLAMLTEAFGGRVLKQPRTDIQWLLFSLPSDILHPSSKLTSLRAFSATERALSHNSTIKQKFLPRF